MKRDIREFIRKLQLLLAVVMAVYPLHWISAAWLGGSRVGIVWLYSAGAVLVGVLALYLPGKMRPVFGGTICLVLLLGTVLLAPGSEKMLWIVQSILAVVQVLSVLPVASKSNMEELSGRWISIGIGAHVAGQIALLTDLAVGRPAWMLRLSFYSFVLLAMLSANRQNLLSASGKRRSVPVNLRSRNVLLTFILFGVSFIGGFLPSALGSVKDIILNVLRWIGDRLVRLLSSGGKDSGYVGQETSADTEAVLGKGARQLEIPPILETIILYIGAAISLCLLGWMLFRLGKKLLRLARESWDLFGKYLSASSEDYVDEVSDTRDAGDAERIWLRRARRIRYREDPSLPPSEQVRRRYQYLKHDHKDWAPGATAREKLPQRAATIYEHARYSERSVSGEEAKVFIDMAKDL